MRKYLPFIIIILLLLLLSISFFVIFEAKIFKSRASQLLPVSANQSYVFTSPLEAKCSGEEVKESIRLTAYTLDNTGRGVLGSKVKLEDTANLKIKGNGVTDAYGMTAFDITCETAGEYYLKVVINDTITLPQKAHLTFR